MFSSLLKFEFSKQILSMQCILIILFHRPPTPRSSAAPNSCNFISSFSLSKIKKKTPKFEIDKLKKNEKINNTKLSTQNKKLPHPQNGVHFMLSNYFGAWSLPWRIVDIYSDTLLEKISSPFPLEINCK